MTMKGTVFIMLAFVFYLVDSLPTTPPVPPPTTTTPPTTTPNGCWYHDKWYAPGTTIDERGDASLDWCYMTFCDINGVILMGDDFNCKTTPPTTIPTTTPNGCWYNNRWYAPGTTIDEGYDASSNWCYFTLCDGDGNILNGDDFNCKTTPSTTIPPTTIPTSTPPNPMVG